LLTKTLYEKFEGYRSGQNLEHILNGDYVIVSVIGAGVIGSAVAKALVENAVEDHIIATDNRVERLVDLEKAGVETTTDNKKAAAIADVVILCVKPKDIKTVLTEIRNEIKGKLVLSVAAGVSLDILKKSAPEARLVRAMPNLAILVCESFTAYCAGANVTSKDKVTIKKVLSVLGTFVEIKEDKMDAVTALSGCAPAYLASLTEAIVRGGTDVGLPADLALAASAQSMVGTGKLILEANKSPAEVIKMVATPGGVTEEELKELAKYPLQQAFLSSLQAGTEKSRKISQSLATEDK
jgi:pyrroline-5-carboxylate reductase